MSYNNIIKILFYKIKKYIYEKIFNYYNKNSFKNNNKI